MPKWEGNQSSYAAVVGKAVAAAMAAAGIQRAEPRGWKCNRSDCLYANKGWENWHGRTRCQGCYQPKTDAMYPPDYACLHPKQRAGTGPSVTTNVNSPNKEDKRRAARTARRQARKERKGKEKENEGPTVSIAKAVQTQAAVPPTAEPGPKTSEILHLALPEKVYEDVALLLPDAAKFVIASLAQETVPTLADAEDPEAVLSKLLKENGPTAKVARLATMESDIAKLKAAIAALKNGGEGVAEALGDLEAKLVAAEAARARVLKDAPTQGFELKAVAEAISPFEVKVQLRKDRQPRGADKAADRAVARHEHIQLLKKQAKALEDAVLELEVENTVKHEDKAKAATELEVKVLKLFDERIAALTAAVPQPGDAGSATAGAQGQAIVAIPQQHLLALPSASVAEVEAAKARIAELEAVVAKSSSLVAQEFERTCDDITPDQFPAAKVPTGNDLLGCAALFKMLQAWATGAAQPFDWTVLAPVVGAEPTVVAKVLLGKVWAKYYPTGTPRALLWCRVKSSWPYCTASAASRWR